MLFGFKPSCSPKFKHSCQLFAGFPACLFIYIYIYSYNLLVCFIALLVTKTLAICNQAILCSSLVAFLLCAYMHFCFLICKRYSSFCGPFLGFQLIIFLQMAYLSPCNLTCLKSFPLLACFLPLQLQTSLPPFLLLSLLLQLGALLQFECLLSCFLCCVHACIQASCFIAFLIVCFLACFFLAYFFVSSKHSCNLHGYSLSYQPEFLTFTFFPAFILHAFLPFAWLST